MFDSLMGRKFTAICKHAVKCIRSRVEPIRRKKKAMLKFLRKDVADLLVGRFDSNAFGRTDALIVEINHAYCYDMIEQYCESILKLLPSMQKQRECPEDAKESVSTLIFAAARFSDLPELCDLRHAFKERYGNYMDSSVNSEFVEKLQKKSFPTEKKLQLMREIAEEFSIYWDFKEFQRKISDPTPAPNQTKNGTPPPPHKGKYELTHKQEDCVLPTWRSETGSRVKVHEEEIQAEPKDIHVIPSSNKYIKHIFDTTHTEMRVFEAKSINVEPKIMENYKGAHKEDDTYELPSYKPSTMAKEDIAAEKTVGSKAGYSIPPYTKARVSKVEVEEKQPNDGSERSERSKPRSVRSRVPRPRAEDEVEQRIKEEEDNDGLMKQASRATSSGNLQKSSEQSAATTAAATNERDEEERVMDKLLLHYSRKGTPIAAGGTMIRVCTKGQYPKDPAFHHGRAISLPPEPIGEESAAFKGPGRSASLTSSDTSGSGRIHPRPPDYDELTARVMALKMG